MEIKDILDYVTGTPRNDNINVLKTMLETLTKEYSISDIGSVRVEDILKYVELTPHNSNVNVLKTMLESLISPGPVVKDEAYAVFDSADGSLVFFRDEPGKYGEGQIIDTKTYYTGIETMQASSRNDVPWYSQRPSLQIVIFQDTISPISTAYWFYNMNHINTITGIERLDTSNVTDMSNMFLNCSLLTTFDVSHFDTSNVTDMSYMFYGCSSLSELDVSHFNTSSVTDMSNMFLKCSSLTTLDLSHFDTSKVTSMGLMFDNCHSLTTLDVSHFDTSNVTEMNGMFRYCESLTALDVSHFDTNSVTNMENMFYLCSSLTATLNIMNMPEHYDNMFLGAATAAGAQVTLKYISPVTSENVDTLVATKSSNANVVNGGEGTFVPPIHS